MLNKILYEGQEICGREKDGKINWFVFKNGEKIQSTALLGKEILIQCHECEIWKNIKFYQGSKGLLKRVYLCQGCSKIGKKNPFYGKQHSEEFKKRLSMEQKGKWAGEKNPMYGRCIWKEMSIEKIKLAKKRISDAVSGEKNGFYGRSHSKSTIEIIKKKNREWRESLTIEDKKKISKSLSDSQKRLFNDNTEKYIANKRNAAFASAKSCKRYKINKIEIIIQNELKKRNLDFKYSVILGYKQFDFGNKKHKILLEVQGDYWHANPNLYGKSKKKLNNIQKLKIKQDKEKTKFAKKHNMKLFRIWEEDIKKNNFSTIDDIERFIKNANKI